MTDRTMRQHIRHIPGEQGWWHRDGKETYLRLAADLRAHGVPADVVVATLTAAYGAAVQELGE